MCMLSLEDKIGLEMLGHICMMGLRTMMSGTKHS